MGLRLPVFVCVSMCLHVFVLLSHGSSTEFTARKPLDIIGLDIVSFGFFDVKLATAGYVSNKGFLQGRHCAIVRAAQDETKCDHVQHHCDSTALKVDPC